MTITPENLVSREVHYCVSYLVSTLAQGYGTVMPGELGDMIEQATELSYPIDDWEEAAIQAGYRWDANTGWYHKHDDSDAAPTYETAQAACEADNLEACQREVFEHWIISDWLADKLAAHGEKVDKDFAGLCIWARTTTGQAIYADHVIEAITAEVNAA